jgi:sec-independent protein translocase protein TatA
VPLLFGQGIEIVNLAVFQSIGPTELLIILGIVLVIFGPKRLPGLGRQLGTGMREFRDSITGKGSRQDESDDDDAEPPAKESPERLQRPEQEASPVEGEVVSERTPR